MKPTPAAISSPATQEMVAAAARLWPHREHESNAVKNLCCGLTLHRWKQLDLSELFPEREIRFCFWCSKIKVDGVVYQP